jgi:single-strand DNA-binding protein
MNATLNRRFRRYQPAQPKERSNAAHRRADAGLCVVRISMLNKVMLIGYAGADSEMKFTSGGTPVANFSLAVNETFKNSQGEKKSNTLWVRCVAWRRCAEIVGEHVTKGKCLFVEGRLQFRTFEDRQGQKHDVTEVVVNTIRFLGPAKNGTGTKSAESPKVTESADENDNPFTEALADHPEQDIPF